jgi:hypothetical protein
MTYGACFISSCRRKERLIHHDGVVLGHQIIGDLLPEIVVHTSVDEVLLWFKASSISYGNHIR